MSECEACETGVFDSGAPVSACFAVSAESASAVRAIAPIVRTTGLSLPGNGELPATKSAPGRALRGRPRVAAFGPGATGRSVTGDRPCRAPTTGAIRNSRRFVARHR